MDIFSILREAKNPSSKSRTTQIGQPPNDSPDYTETVDDADDTSDAQNTPESDDTTSETDDNEQTDYTDDVDDDNAEQESSDDTTDDENSEDNTEDADSVDYTDSVDDDDSGESQDGDDQSTEDTTDTNADLSPEEKDELKKNALLIKNCIDLYYSMKIVCDKLSNISNMNILTNKINIQVKKNLTDTLSQLYDLITVSFINNTYTKNLYLYNSFIEVYKMNIEMLRKNEQFE